MIEDVFLSSSLLSLDTLEADLASLSHHREGGSPARPSEQVGHPEPKKFLEF
jgi:hypothetical protein